MHQSPQTFASWPFLGTTLSSCAGIILALVAVKFQKGRLQEVAQTPVASLCLINNVLVPYKSRFCEVIPSSVSED